MTSGVPSHHVRQTVCATRPPYREGRHPKAVKVYTVNNESCYILIQGVPSVGAMQELHKLCSSFGNVAQFNALDDYPNDDKYNEVYLAKYDKIQSARFAKRKLDDHSFFGGTLHVCYAPEYEIVTETREKLQDRRRVIAAKIRQFADNTGNQHQLQISNQHSAEKQHSLQISNQHSAEKQHSLQISNQHNAEKQHSLQFFNQHNAENQHSQQIPNQQSISYHANNSVNSSNVDQLSFQKEQLLPVHGHYNAGTSLHIQGRLDSSPGAGEPISRLSVAGKEYAQATFQLPLPPKSELSHIHSGKKPNVYEFSRVRSSHETLPPEYNSQMVPSTLNKSAHPETNTSRTLHMPVANSPHDSEILNLLSFTPSSSKTTLSSSTIIIKDYKPSKPAPRFVPRQALRTKLELLKPTTLSKSKIDPLDQEIRKNAFHLGDTQGPAVVPPRKRPFPTKEQLSVNETISEIRNKISKVITHNVQKQTDLPGK